MVVIFVFELPKPRPIKSIATVLYDDSGAHRYAVLGWGWENEARMRRRGARVFCKISV